MFVLLLVVTFTLATAASYGVARLFNAPLSGIVTRLVPDEFAVAWQRYILFGLFLVGVNGGGPLRWDRIRSFIVPLEARGSGAHETRVRPEAFA